MKKTPQRKRGMDMDAIRKLELVPDAWPVFERAVKLAGEMEHKPHHPKEKADER